MDSVVELRKTSTPNLDSSSYPLNDFPDESQETRIQDSTFGFEPNPNSCKMLTENIEEAAEEQHLQQVRTPIMQCRPKRTDFQSSFSRNCSIIMQTPEKCEQEQAAVQKKMSSKAIVGDRQRVYRMPDPSPNVQVNQPSSSCFSEAQQASDESIGPHEPHSASAKSGFHAGFPETKQEQKSIEVEEFKILRKWPIAFMIACTAGQLKFWTSPDVQYSYMVFSCIPFTLCDIALWALLVLSFKKTPSLIRVILVVLHERLLLTLYLFIIQNECEYRKEGEFTSKYAHALLTNSNFLIQCVIINTGITLKVLPKKKVVQGLYIFVTFAQVVALQTYHFNQIKEYGGEESRQSIDFQEFFLVFTNNVVLTILFYATVSINKAAFGLYTSQIVEKSKQNEQYKRMIDAIGEGMMVVQKGVVMFKNQIASSFIKEENEELVTDAKIFHIFKETEEVENKQRNDTFPSQILNRSLETAASGYSINELIEGRKHLCDHYIFTFNEEYSRFTHMNELQGLVEKQKEAGLDETASFDFFLIKVFPLARVEDGEEPEFAIELIDISQKIMMDSMNTERKYMAYMNSTISHEMRNPLNSIHSQIQVIKSRLEDHFELLNDHQGLAQDEIIECKEAQRAVSSSLSICSSSSKLLLFNVEDILALPRLKEGRFTKNIQRINIARAIDEVMSIQALQAEEKGVKLRSAYAGFEDVIQSPQGVQPAHRIPIDEKRFQQVLLNYQSNALKFLNKKESKVLILLQYIDSQVSRQQAEVDFRVHQTEFFMQNIYEDPIDPGEIFRYGEGKMIVLSVLDNGIGVKEEDQAKLFKLFGCLKNTRSMNTQGIGLGLVITKMITEEFGGMTQMHSVYQMGSIFQSSFSVPETDTAKRLSSFSDTKVSLLKTDMLNKASPNFLMFQKCLDVYSKLQHDQEFYFSKKKILIIDDESFNCQAMLGMISVLKLPMVNERVDLAYSGQEALDLVQENLEQDHEGRWVCNYAVIFTDCSMPFMDGYECCQRMHSLLDSHGVAEKPKILAVTGHVESEYQRKALLSGMDSIFSKPIKIDQLAMALLEQGFNIKVPKSLESELSEALK